MQAMQPFVEVQGDLAVYAAGERPVVFFAIEALTDSGPLTFAVNEDVAGVEALVARLQAWLAAHREP